MNFDAISGMIVSLKQRGSTASGQRSAFAAIRAKVAAMVGQDVDSEVDAGLREAARNASGLSLFPSQAKAMGTPSDRTTAPKLSVSDERLLDVEIVAMYW